MASSDTTEQEFQLPLEHWHLYFIEQLLSHIPFNEGDRALEIGCGRGELARELIRRFDSLHIEGIDSDLCGHSHTRNEQESRLSIQVMSVTDMSFPDNHFNAAYSLNVFEHIHDLDAAFREIHRVLKPGGRLYAVMAPLWTSYRGHHFYHWLPEYQNLIEPWDHLLLSKRKFHKKIAKARGRKTADEAIEYVYVSDFLNRKPLHDFLNSMEQSELKLISIEKDIHYELQTPPSLTRKKKVAKVTGLPIETLEVDGLKIVMEKQ